MRKNSIRKLIHGILDLLPLFVIPIFAININQKSVEPISILIADEEVGDFNQYADFEYPIVRTADGNNSSIKTLNYDTTHKYYYEYTLDIDETYSGITFYLGLWNQNSKFARMSWTFEELNNNIYGEFVPNTNNLDSFESLTMILQTIGNGVVTSSNQVQISKVMFTDLTQMYGTGNEPTIEYYHSWLNGRYFNYVESNQIMVPLPTGTLYNNTDIGSQFLYSLYISTDKYFNMNNVFNLNSVYQWFEINIFNGTAPLSIYIVWNIIIYELVMDLLMLLYALFMFFIDACQKLIDKPLNSIK